MMGKKIGFGHICCIALLCSFVMVAGSGLASAAVDQGLVILMKKGTEYSNADLDGEYSLSNLTVQDLKTPSGVPEKNIESAVTWGEMLFTSATQALAAKWENFQSDTKTIEKGSDNGTFSIAADGAWSHDLNEGETLSASLDGRISANRQYLLLMEGNEWAPNGQTELSLLMAIDKPPTGTFGPDNNMDGSYHVILMQMTDISEMDPRAVVMRATMDINNGQWTANQTYFTSKGNLVEDEPDAGTISLSADGGIEIDTPGENELYIGQLSQDKQVFAITKGVEDTAGNIDTTLAVGIRAAAEGQSFGPSDLEGEYRVGGMSIVDIEDTTAADRDGGSFWASISFDGAGGATYTGETFGADADVSAETGSGTYAVEPNGDVTILLTVIPNEIGAHALSFRLQGHLSADGEVMALVFGQTDGDGDGLADQAEYGPSGNDTTYDGNNDTIADSAQANVASCPTADGLGYVTLAVDPALTLTNVATLTNPSPATAPSDMSFDWGFLEFTIEGLTGRMADLQIFLPAGDTVDNYYKFGPTAADPTNHWYGFEYDAATGRGAEYNANVITLHLEDGADGDDDLTVDGKIVDAGGPSVAAVGAGSNPPPAATTSSGGSSGGCFIRSLE